MARPEAAHGKTAFDVLDALGLGFGFGETGPGDFRIGVGDGRDLAGVEGSLLAGSSFGGDVRLVHSLVRQHRLADDIADGKDVGHVGAHAACRFR